MPKLRRKAFAPRGTAPAVLSWGPKARYAILKVSLPKGLKCSVPLQELLRALYRALAGSSALYSTEHLSGLVPPSFFPYSANVVW